MPPITSDSEWNNQTALAVNMAFIFCLINALFYARHYQTATVQRSTVNNLKYLETLSFTYFTYFQGKESSYDGQKL